MKKISDIFGKPIICLVAILLTVVSFILTKTAPAHMYNFPDYRISTRTEPMMITSVALSSSGAYAYLECSNYNFYIMAVSSEGKSNMIPISEKEYSYRDLCFDDQNRLYVLSSKFLKNGNEVKEDAILRADIDSGKMDTFYSLDYNDFPDKPTRVGRINNISYYDGGIYFAYVDENRTELIRMDTTTQERTTIRTYESEGDGSYICRAWASENEFLLLKTDGRLYRTDGSEELGEPVYVFDTPVDDRSENFLPYFMTICNDKIYMSTSIQDSYIYRIEDGEIIDEFTIDDLYEYASEEEEYVSAISGCGDRIIAAISDSVFLYDGDTAEVLNVSYHLDFLYWFYGVLPILHIVMVIVSAILLILYIVFVKKTIMIKQMLAYIPPIIINAVVIYCFLSSLVDYIYNSILIDETLTVTELVGQNLDMDGFSDVEMLSDIDQKELLKLHNKVLNLINRNRTEWSDKYDVFISLEKEENERLCIVASNEITAPLECSPVFFAGDYHLKKTGVRGTKIYQADSDIGTYCGTSTLYSSDGDKVGILYVCTNSYSMYHKLTRDKRLIWVIMLPVAAAMVIIMSVLVVRMTSKIRKASNTVTRISEGDLSARITTRSKDEIGDICRQVNSMAENLDTLFKENKKNEEFYYKFVPEKFKEFLGKEKITDLALGDAESREFTVLFCDIRSFSLNSEMLTAKENFEFVNIIYGIAGPIIRKYNGFVDKYIGDAVMALFDTAEAAILAGREIYSSIVLDPETAHRLHISYIKVGVGIHTGIARIGIVGEEERLSGTVISNSVNISSRLESLTKTYQTAMIFTKETLDKLPNPDGMNLRYLGMVQVAGVNEVKSLYEELDSLPDDLREIRMANKDDFREAVRLFHLGDRAGSIKMFESIKEKGMADSTVDMYLEYVKELSPDDKSNVFRFTKK
ncbi:MAG: adenylate/guanylate cyclase domain-containing protein [Eubacterium sp.]|nr:adenylate/guanylate cyclase domain-containing protein [Eubacterium sp.]